MCRSMFAKFTFRPEHQLFKKMLQHIKSADFLLHRPLDISINAINLMFYLFCRVPPLLSWVSINVVWARPPRPPSCFRNAVTVHITHLVYEIQRSYYLLSETICNIFYGWWILTDRQTDIKHTCCA